MQFTQNKSHANSAEADWGEAKQEWLQQHNTFMNLRVRNKLCPKSVFHTELSYDRCVIPEVPSNVPPAYMYRTLKTIDLGLAMSLFAAVLCQGAALHGLYR